MTRPQVDARRATADDLDDLLLLWTQAREELGRSSRLPSLLPLDQLRARLEDALAGGDLIMVIGRYEGAAAGYAVLRLAPVLLVDGDAMHVEHLFVLPSVRRRGVARAILVVATSVAERHGAEQIMAGAPPSARETHRFLARLGFSPLVVRRVVGTAALRRRLAGEGPRRGLEDLLSRRRSLRARSLRAGWGGRQEEAEPDDEADPSPSPSPSPSGPQLALAGPDGCADRAATLVVIADGAVQRIDLSQGPDSSCPVAARADLGRPAVEPVRPAPGGRSLPAVTSAPGADRTGGRAGRR